MWHANLIILYEWRRLMNADLLNEKTSTDFMYFQKRKEKKMIT